MVDAVLVQPEQPATQPLGSVCRSLLAGDVCLLHVGHPAQDVGTVTFIALGTAPGALCMAVPPRPRRIVAGPGVWWGRQESFPWKFWENHSKLLRNWISTVDRRDSKKVSQRLAGRNLGTPACLRELGLGHADP